MMSQFFSTQHRFSSSNSGRWKQSCLSNLKMFASPALKLIEIHQTEKFRMVHVLLRKSEVFGNLRLHVRVTVSDRLPRCLTSSL